MLSQDSFSTETVGFTGRVLLTGLKNSVIMKFFITICTITLLYSEPNIYQ